MSPSHSLVTDADAPKEAPKDVPSATKGSISPTPVPTPTSPLPLHHKPVTITPDSIQQIPPYRPRKSKEWIPVEVNDKRITRNRGLNF